MKKKHITLIIVIFVALFVGHYYYVHSSTKRVFASQKQLGPLQYVDTIYHKNDAYTLEIRTIIINKEYMVYAIPMNKNFLGWRIVHSDKFFMNRFRLSANGSGASVLGKDSRLSLGIVDSSVQAATLHGKKLAFIKYKNIRFWYQISKPTNQFLVKPLLRYK